MAVPAKDVVVKLGEVEFTVPAGSKVLDAAAAAGVEIPALTINGEVCKGCGLCARNCAAGAITGEKKQPHHIDPDKCVKCGECLAKCKFGAIVPA